MGYVFVLEDELVEWWVNFLDYMSFIFLRFDCLVVLFVDEIGKFVFLSYLC